MYLKYATLIFMLELELKAIWWRRYVFPVTFLPIINFVASCGLVYVELDDIQTNTLHVDKSVITVNHFVRVNRLVLLNITQVFYEGLSVFHVKLTFLVKWLVWYKYNFVKKSSKSYK